MGNVHFLPATLSGSTALPIAAFGMSGVLTPSGGSTTQHITLCPRRSGKLVEQHIGFVQFVATVLFAFERDTTVPRHSSFSC
jgi:hypothetical protein